MSTVRSTRLRTIGAILAVTVTAAALSACSSSAKGRSGASSTATGSSTSFTTEKITYGIVGTPPVWDSLTPYVAQQEGFFKKYGLDVSFKTFPGGVDDAKALASNQIDMGPSPVFQNIDILGKGGKLTAVAGQATSDYVLGTTDSSVTDCNSLKGKTIGIDATGGVTYTALGVMLTYCGLTMKDVKTINFGTAIVQPMAQGQVKTAVVHVDEAAQIQALSKKEVRTVVELQKAQPLTYYAFTSVSSHFLSQRRDVAVRAVAAYIEAVRWMMSAANEKAFATLAAAKTGESIDVATAAAQKYVALQFWPVDDSGLKEANFNATVEQEIAKKDVTAGQAPTYQQVVDESVYADALALVKKSG